MNREGYSVSLRIQSECGKIRTGKTPYLDTFHAVIDVDSKEVKKAKVVNKNVVKKRKRRTFVDVFFDKKNDET